MIVKTNGLRSDDVNETLARQGVASGRGGRGASRVVNMQKSFNRNLRVGTWNVRTMTRAEKVENVEQEIHRMGIQIIGLTEVRWKRKEDICSDDVRMIYSGGTERDGGVAILLDCHVAQSVDRVEPINDRLLMVKLRGDRVDIMMRKLRKCTTALKKC